MKPTTTRLGYRQQFMLDFVSKHGADRRYTIDPDENRVAYSLQQRGLLHVIDCGMSTTTGRTVLMVTGVS
jgi:hypothetical protein